MWGKLIKEIVTAAGREAIDHRMKKGAVNKAASQRGEQVLTHISSVSYHPNRSVWDAMVGELSITSMTVRFAYRPHVSLKISPTQIDMPETTITQATIEKVKLGFVKQPVVTFDCSPFPSGAKSGALFFCIQGKGMDNAIAALVQLLGPDRVKDSR